MFRYAAFMGLIADPRNFDADQCECVSGNVKAAWHQSSLFSIVLTIEQANTSSPVSSGNGRNSRDRQRHFSVCSALGLRRPLSIHTYT